MTPMIRQYLSIKKKLPEAILFFRLGDFYEMFFEDAEKASAILDITLTSRDGGSAGKVPMCGVPYHSATNYINRLTREGFKVAICEQVEDPQLAKGLVKREVVKIITPGTNLEDDELSFHSNYLVSTYFQDKVWGVSFLDLSTGVFKLTEVKSDEEVIDEICRLAPRELVLCESMKGNEMLAVLLRERPSIVSNYYEDWVFDFEHSQEQLKRQFQLISLEGLGLHGFTAGISAAGALLHYLKDNLHTSLTHLKRPHPYSSTDYMRLDRRTQNNLELVDPLSGDRKEITLFGVLNNTSTPMGARLLYHWIKTPLLSLPLIRERYDAIEELMTHQEALTAVRTQLKRVRDMERLLGRITCGICSARDLVALKDSLKVVPGVKGSISLLNSSLLVKQRGELFAMEDLVSLIEEAVVDEPPLSLKEGGIIKKGYHVHLDELREVARDGKRWVAQLQSRERERTGIKSLKIEFNKVFGYYIEVTKPNLSLVPEDYVRKQTLVNTERFITGELKEMENTIVGAEEKAHALEYEIFEGIRQRVIKSIREIQRTAEALALVDVLASLATVALRNSYRRPEIGDDATIAIKGGRHPVVEKVIGEGQFIENDVLLDRDDNQLLIITGPNMAGKSTYIRQVALIVIMAQMGSFVPAEHAHIGTVDRIFTRIGATDNIARGESTFMVEMIETATILNNMGEKSLVILDEVGRGTSTFDGISIAWAVCEFLNRSQGPRPKTLFATHYHELTELEHYLRGVKNYHITAKEVGDEIVFIRKINPGGADRSYGIHVGKLAGLPEEVIERAKEVLYYLEQEKISDEVLAAPLRRKKRKAVLTSLPLFRDLGREPVVQSPPQEKYVPTLSCRVKSDRLQLLLKEIAELNIEEMTPLEALHKLYLLKKNVVSLVSPSSSQTVKFLREEKPTL